MAATRLGETANANTGVRDGAQRGVLLDANIFLGDEAFGLKILAQISEAEVGQGQGRGGPQWRLTARLDINTIRQVAVVVVVAVGLLVSAAAVLPGPGEQQLITVRRQAARGLSQLSWSN